MCLFSNKLTKVSTSLVFIGHIECCKRIKEAALWQRVKKRVSTLSQNECLRRKKESEDDYETTRKPVTRLLCASCTWQPDEWVLTAGLQQGHGANGPAVQQTRDCVPTGNVVFRNVSVDENHLAAEQNVAWTQSAEVFAAAQRLEFTVGGCTVN